MTLINLIAKKKTSLNYKNNEITMNFFYSVISLEKFK